MRTKEQALYGFWAGFGIPAYEENSVPSDSEGKAIADFPYITYQVVTDSFGSAVSMTANVWDRDRAGHSAEVFNSAKVQEIAQTLSGGINVLYDGGCVRLSKGAPFAQNTGDPSDDAVRRKLLNVTAHYISEY